MTKETPSSPRSSPLASAGAAIRAAEPATAAASAQAGAPGTDPAPGHTLDQAPGPKPGLFPPTQYRMLGFISLAHFFNDATQSLIIPIYPLLKSSFGLSFAQIGFITFTYQVTASLLQPLVGMYTDRNPLPRSLPIGMAFTLCGLLLMSVASSYHWILLASALLGSGTSVFHPESSRAARMAAGGRFGLAQSMFQVGGNAGYSLGPLLAAAVIMPLGQWSLSLFAVLPAIGIVLLTLISNWMIRQGVSVKKKAVPSPGPDLPKAVIVRTMLVLLFLVFSKYFYMSSITNYFIFYLTHKFGISEQAGQIHLFLFLAAVAAGTLIGGPVGDRIGRKYVIWVSILGITPFTLALPHMNLAGTTVLIVIIGFVLASAFSAIVVFAQELLPGHVGAIAGLFFGLSFGLGGMGAALFGRVADLYGIELVYHLCSFLPLLGLLAVFLPNLKEKGA